jgi:hypothetical protein
MTDTVNTSKNSKPEPTAEISPLAVAMISTARELAAPPKNPSEHRQSNLVVLHPGNDMPAPVELRKAARYQFDSPAVIRWLCADEHIHQAFAIVRDIAISGVFFESTALINLNANIELDIAPPSLHPHSGLEFYFEGRVIRAENRGGRNGFAVAGSLQISSDPGLDSHSDKS